MSTTDPDGTGEHEVAVGGGPAGQTAALYATNLGHGADHYRKFGRDARVADGGTDEVALLFRGDALLLAGLLPGPHGRLPDGHRARGVSLAASVALWWYFETAVFFLFVPFVPFLLRGGAGGGGEGASRRRPPERVCPRCGFRTRDPEYGFCPRDGSRLEVDGGGGEF